MLQLDEPLLSPTIAPIYRPFIEGRAMGFGTDLKRT